MSLVTSRLRCQTATYFVYEVGLSASQLHFDNFSITINKRQGHFLTVAVAPFTNGPVVVHVACPPFVCDVPMRSLSWAFKISVAFRRQKRALAGRFNERKSARASSVMFGCFLSTSIVICSLSGLLSRLVVLIDASVSSRAVIPC